MEKSGPDPLAQYLSRLRAALEGLPASKRDDAFREMAQHIEALMDERVRAGVDRNEAVQTALQKFGDPEDLAKKLVNDYWAKAFLRQQSAKIPRPLPDYVMFIVYLCICIAGVQASHLPEYGLPISAAVIGIGYGVLNGFQWSAISISENAYYRKRKLWVEKHSVPGHFTAYIVAVFVLTEVVIFIWESIQPHTFIQKRAHMIIDTASIAAWCFCFATATLAGRRIFLSRLVGIVAQGSHWYW